jgi:hypothetical protein
VFNKEPGNKNSGLRTERAIIPKMKLKLIILLVLSGYLGVYGRPFKIIFNNGKGTSVTDTIHSGDFILGINDFGGGTISMISIPGLGNIMGPEALSFGRMGQSSIRDAARSGKYNPTQAGFHETIGTECAVTKTTGKMVVEPRGCALWRADNAYDYTRWENIGSDGYNEETKHGGINSASDEDNLDEENLSVTINGNKYTKQEAEVYSEFDFYAVYENVKGKNGVTIPAIRHYFEYRYIRPSGHCMNQFNSGTSVWNADGLEEDISVQYPEGKFSGTDKDLSDITASWSIRNDLALWDPRFLHIQKNNGTWEIRDRTKVNNEDDTGYKQFIIVGESSDVNSGKALGFYRPNTEINKHQVIGVRESDGSIYYTDSRLTKVFWNDSPYRTPKMSWIGFRNNSRGLINRDRLPSGIYEAYRQETFLFYGTPQEIKDAVAEFDKNNKLTQSTTFFDLPVKRIGEDDFSPSATSNSGLPVSYTSSNPSVATIIDGKIHLTGVGTSEITASQSGNDTYKAAANVTRTLTVTFPTGTVELPDNQLEIYPNPAREFVQIKLGIEDVPVEIFNFWGQMVYSVAGVKNEIRIPVYQIGGPGLYFVKVENTVRKLVIGA